MRQFFSVYSDEVFSIRQKAYSELQTKGNQPAIIQQAPFSEINKFTLNWSHYLILMRIANPEERKFYEIEAQQ